MTHTVRNLTISLLGILAILVLAGCTQGTQGIFATIEAEEETTTSNLVDNTSVTALVRVTVDGTDRYVVLAGQKTFYRNAADAAWSEVPGGTGGAFHLAGVDTDGAADRHAEEVYAFFYDSGDAEYHLYRLVTSGGDGPEWSEVTDTTAWNPADGYEVSGMRGIGDTLLLSVTRNPGADDAAAKNRELWSVAGGGPGLSAPVVLGDFPASLRDAARNGNAAIAVGAETFIARISDVNTAGSLTDISGSVKNAVAVGAFPSSLSGGGSDAMAIVTLEGTIWVSTDDGASWNQATGSLSSRSLSDIAWLSDRNIFVVGTRSDTGFGTIRRGYYEATASGSAPYSFSFTSDLGNSYDGSELAIAAVSFFEYFPQADTLFSLTNGTGLWSAVYDGGNPDWKWE